MATMLPPSCMWYRMVCAMLGRKFGFEGPCSTIITRRPRSASTRAMAAPPGPEPMITSSTSCRTSPRVSSWLQSVIVHTHSQTKVGLGRSQWGAWSTPYSSRPEAQRPADALQSGASPPKTAGRAFAPLGSRTHSWSHASRGSTHQGPGSTASTTFVAREPSEGGLHQQMRRCLRLHPTTMALHQRASTLLTRLAPSDTRRRKVRLDPRPGRGPTKTHPHPQRLRMRPQPATMRPPARVDA